MRKIKGDYMKKCECNKKGVLNPIIEHMYDKERELPFVNHKPNKCRCTNDLKQYIRKSKKLWLCSCCCLSSDKECK